MGSWDSVNTMFVPPYSAFCRLCPQAEPVWLRPGPAGRVHGRAGRGGGPFGALGLVVGPERAAQQGREDEAAIRGGLPVRLCFYIFVASASLRPCGSREYESLLS